MQAFKKSSPSEILKKIIECPMPAFVALFSGYVMSMFYRSFLAIVAGDLIVPFLCGVFIDHAEAAGVDAARRYATLHIVFGAVLLATAAIHAPRRGVRSEKAGSPPLNEAALASPRIAKLGAPEAILPAPWPKWRARARWSRALRRAPHGSCGGGRRGSCPRMPPT